MKEYQVEALRHNVSAKSFYSYCAKQAHKKGLDVEAYLEYEDWKRPISPCDIRNKHKDWEEPKTEICKHLPYDAQFYLQGSYNFIMEWEDGTGYMWIYECRD